METGIEVESAVPGWGEWSGPGIKKRKRPVKKITKFLGVEVEKRKDFKLKHVIINEKRQKKV
jgi:U3 small nucleolar RNA-associated protein 14